VGLGEAAAEGASGAGGISEPFLMRRSPFSALRTIFAVPEPIRPLTVLISSPLTARPKSVTMSPLRVRPSTVA
jgi:hypothetical protein